MMNGEDGRMPGNWGIAITRKDSGSVAAERYDKHAKAKLDELKRKYADKTERPSVEFSVMIRDGELAYVGRYEEGVVLRLSGNEDKVTFLTTEMAVELGQALSTRI